MAVKLDIPFFRYPTLFSSDKDNYLSIISAISARGAFILQDELVQFEKKLAEFLGVEFAIGLANCTDALMLALRAAEISPGDEVIFCSHTMTATAAAIHFIGAKPIAVDCGFDNLIDLDSIRQAVTERTTAILPTHLNGRCCEMDPILEIAERYNLKIIEDAAQALGARYCGKHAGTFGLAGAFSFYPAKTLGCFGDGGALVTNHREVAEKVRMLRDHGRDSCGNTIGWGLNSRLDNLQAGILLQNLRRYPEMINRRRKLASLYNRRLSALKELLLPPPPDDSRESISVRHFDIYQNYEIQAEHRDELQAFLKSRGIGTLVQWGGKAVHQIEALGFDAKLPRVEAFFTKCLMLPLNLSISDVEANLICDAIQEFYCARNS